MAELVMGYIFRIGGFFVWAFGLLLSILSERVNVLDESLSVIAGLIGIIGGIVWVTLLFIKRKSEKLECEIKMLEKQRLLNEIKSSELN